MPRRSGRARAQQCEKREIAGIHAPDMRVTDQYIDPVGIGASSQQSCVSQYIDIRPVMRQSNPLLSSFWYQ